MLGSPGRGLGYSRGHRGRPPFRQNNAIDAGAIGGAEQRSQVVGVFDAIKSKEEPVPVCLAGRQQVLNSEELALPNDRQDALMRIGAGKPGELVPGFERYADPGGAAKLDQPFQAIISTLPSNSDMIELPRT
jgi:hypothetical protein